MIARLTGLDAALEKADLVLTGEGSLDEQSRYGKAPLSVAERARDAGLPVVALAGRITLSPQILAEYGVVSSVSLLHLVQDPQDAMTQARRCLTRATVAALEGV